MHNIQGDSHDLRLINLAGVLAENGITTLALVPTSRSHPSTPITLTARTCNLAQILRDLGPCTFTGHGPHSLASANVTPNSISLQITPKNAVTPLPS